MLFRSAEDSPDVVVGDCPLAGLRITKANGGEVLHPAVALARTYGLNID